MGEVAQYAPGQQLPGTVYRVVRHLATGGMGSVYDVEDVTVGKRYVLKTLHPQLVSRHDLAKRMEAEARTLAKLQHPNIVDVVTAGLTTDEQRMPFYVMERLNGQNLRVVIEKKGSLELTHCYRIAIDVLDALEHAHENSVIHRDVKPDNIFLHRNANGTTTTKLLDFGIMRLLDRKASHTQGKFIGTLRYASPEQIFGGDLGPPSDIYSLGLVLYEMIAGRGPFDELADAYAIGAAHAQNAPPPVSTFVAVPQGLERLVMASIAKHPHERPRDCFSFASELRRMLRDEEAAPRSATAINVLTSGPSTRSATSLPLAGTELSPAPPTPPQGATSPTDIDIGAASTLASEPGASGSGWRGHGPARLGSVPGMKPPIDRAADTRASTGSGATQRLAQYGTAMDDPSAPPLLPDDAVRAALAQREPLEVPPTSGQPHDSREIVFPRTHGIATGTGGTGPLAGEALTRPPERSMLMPLFAAALVGATVVGGAILLVTKPWEKHASGGAPLPAVTTATASATVTEAPTPKVVPAPMAVAPAVAAPTPATGRAAPLAARPAATATASPRTPAAQPASPATPAPPAKKPTRPAGAAPRPEDVGFE